MGIQGHGHMIRDMGMRTSEHGHRSMGITGASHCTLKCCCHHVRLVSAAMKRQVVRLPPDMNEQMNAIPLSTSRVLNL